MGATHASGDTPDPATVNPDTVDVPSLSLSHPKNYLGVPIAVTAPRDTGALVMNHLTSMAGACKRGAHAFGLIDDTGAVTDWFRGILAGVLNDYTPLEYLSELAELKNAKGRFVEQRPEWAQFGEAIARQYPATDSIVNLLHRTGKIALPELVAHLAKEHKSLLKALFLSTDDIPNSTDICDLTLEDSSLYQSVGVCQFKSALYHLGVLTTAGSSTDYLVPVDQTWELEPTVSAGGWL